MSKLTKLDRGKALLFSGYSVMPVDKYKIPCWYESGKRTWKRLMTEPLSESELEVAIDHEKTWRYGYATGYNDVFCLDVDCKVLSTEERMPFWTEFISLLRDNIDGLDKKVSIHRTLNYGYHLTYRLYGETGNHKLAVPVKTGVIQEGKTKVEALLETRGSGGYAVLYDDCYNGLDYTEIQYLSDEEHEIVMHVCAMYDERVEEQEVVQPKKEPLKNDNIQYGVSPWDEFNLKNSVLDVVGDEFKVIRQITSKTIIKRHGATSAHSGYIYKDSGCMYLFSTGTVYPNEKLLSPAACYAYKNHNGDFSAAAKDLYSKGYGDRVVMNVPSVVQEEVKIDNESLEFPIDIFPNGVQRYIVECNNTLDSSIDYMGVSMVWMLSVIIGNSIKIEVKTGWNEISTVWIACVGKAGVGKTPSIDNIVKPLININSREIKDFNRAYAKFMEYDRLSERDKKNTAEVRKPIKKQFIVNDVTMEALVELHEENPNSVAVFKDELAGWMKDMDKYRAGSDLEFWLSSWSGKPISLNRKTVKNNYVHRPLIPVLGGIQPGILSDLFTVQNKENGFVDRMLLSFPELGVENYNTNQMPKELLDWYIDYILQMHSQVKTQLIKFDEDQDIIPNCMFMDSEAEQEWVRIYNGITDSQNSDDENEYMKSMLPKQKSYIPRFAMLLNALNNYDAKKPLISPVTKKSMLAAEKLSNYFIAMAKKVKKESVETNKLKAIANEKKNYSEIEKLQAMLTLNPNLNKTEAGEILGVSRTTIYSWIKQLQG